MSLHELDADPDARRARLAALAAIPADRLAALSDADVIEMLKTIGAARYLARTDRTLFAELPAADPPGFEPRSLRLAQLLFALTLLALVAACGLFKWMLT